MAGLLRFGCGISHRPGGHQAPVAVDQAHAMPAQPAVVIGAVPERLRRQRYRTAELGRFKRGLLGLMRRVTGRLPRTPRDLMAEAECLHVVGEREMETSRDLLERALPPTGLDPDQALEMVRQHEPAGVYSATTFVTMARPSGAGRYPHYGAFAGFVSFRYPDRRFVVHCVLSAFVTGHAYPADILQNMGAEAIGTEMMLLR